LALPICSYDEPISLLAWISSPKTKLQRTVEKSWLIWTLSGNISVSIREALEIMKSLAKIEVAGPKTLWAALVDLRESAWSIMSSWRSEAL